MTRPTKLTPELQRLIADNLRVGATRTDAVLSAGVSYQTFLNWLEKGRTRKRGIYVEFFESVERAEAEARLNFTRVITRASADGEWRAALEYLKRRDRQNWGDNVDVTSAGEKIEIVVTYATDTD